MTLPKLKKKVKGIWEKSAKRLNFSVLKKVAVVFLILGLNWSGIAAIGQTVSYFNDEENSSGNVLAAGSLDIVLSPDGTFASGLMYPGDSAVSAINLTNSGTLPYQYTARTEILGGAPACGHFTMTATDGIYSYSGAIGGFTSPASASSGAEDWTFTFNLSPSAPPEVWGQSCFFKWIFSAWQTDFADPANGFYDTDERLGVLRIGKAVVLNEFIPNPVGPEDAPKPGGEWVELYNNSSASFDLNGWVIYDNNDAHELYITASKTNTGGTIISPHGFLVVYRDGDSDFNLNNDGDSVRLYTGYPPSSSILVDSYTYTMKKPEGFSFARLPDGVGAWVDPMPTPGRPNVLSGDEIVAQDEDFVLDTVSEIAGAFEEVLGLDQTDQTASGSQEIITASGSFENIASPSENQDEMAEPAPVASESVEPLVEPPLDSPAGDLTGQALPEVSPEVTPEPVDDDSSIQEPTEPAIPVEPVTPSAGSGQAIETPTEPAPPPADPPLPTSPSENLGGQAAPADSTSSPQAE